MLFRAKTLRIEKSFSEISHKLQPVNKIQNRINQPLPTLALEDERPGFESRAPTPIFNCCGKRKEGEVRRNSTSVASA